MFKHIIFIMAYIGLEQKLNRRPIKITRYLHACERNLGIERQNAA